MHELVMKFWKNPINKVDATFASEEYAEGMSPVCGDSVTIYKTSAGLFYSGSMCALCNASASALVNDPTQQPTWLKQIAIDHPMRSGCIELPWQTFTLIKETDRNKNE